MAVSLFLAKVMGLLLVIMSIFTLSQKKYLEEILKDGLKSPALIFFSGVVALIVGIILVVSHSIWSPDWRLIITIFGWLILIKGLSRLFLPELTKKMLKATIESDTLLIFSAFFIFIIGVYLLFAGYYSV